MTDDAIEALAPTPAPVPGPAKGAPPAPEPTSTFLIKAEASPLGRKGTFVELTRSEAAAAAGDVAVPTPEQLAMRPRPPTEVFV